METLQSTIQFVSSNANAESSNTATSAATGDISLFVILFIIFISSLALLSFVYMKNRKFINATNSQNINSVTCNKNTIKIFTLIVIAILSACIFCFANQNQALANNQGRVSEVIKAIVNEDTGAVTIDNGELSNIDKDGVLTVNTINVLKKLDIGNCTWTLKIDDSVVYDGQADKKQTLEKEIAIKDKNAILSISTNIEFNIAKNLIGKEPVVIEYSVAQKCQIAGNINLKDEQIDSGTATFYKTDGGNPIASSDINAYGNYAINLEKGETGYIRYRANNIVPIDTDDFTIDKNKLMDNVQAEPSCNLVGKITDKGDKALSGIIIEIKLGELGPKVREFRTESQDDGSFNLQVLRQKDADAIMNVYDPELTYVFPKKNFTDFSQKELPVDIDVYKKACSPINNEILDYNGQEQIGVEFDDTVDLISGTYKATEIGSYKVDLKPADGYAWPEDSTTDERVFIWFIQQPMAKITEYPKKIFNLKFTGQELTLAHEGKAEGGTLLYRVIKDNSSLQDDEWKTTIDTKIDVGSYFIKYYVKGDETHQDFPVNTLKVNIYEKLLNDYSWSELKTIADDLSEYEQKSKYYNTFNDMAEDGQTKITELKNKDILENRIIGICEDNLSDQNKKAGLTFMSANVIDQGFYSGNKGDASSTYAAGWANSPLRESMQKGGYIYNLMPDELTEKVSTVTKESTEGWLNENDYSDKIVKTNDTYFIPSGYELGANIFSKDEGQTYSFASNDPWQMNWSTFGTGPTDNTLNHKGFLFVKEHQHELFSPMDAHTQAYNNGGVVRKDGKDIDYEYFCWLRSTFDENPYDQGCLYYSGNVNNIGWVKYQACVAPCFCL